MAGCRSCGGKLPLPPDPNRGVEGYWSVKWPHGPLQRFASQEAAEAFVDAHPGRNLRVLVPVTLDD